VKAIATAALGVVLGAIPQSAVPVPRGMPVTAIALAGARVEWAAATKPPSVYLGRHLTWRARVVPVPSDAAADPRFNSSVVQLVTRVAASPRLVAFIHSAALVQRWKCYPGCKIRDFGRELLDELWAGPPQGPFRRLVRVADGSRLTGVAVSGRRILFALQPIRARGFARIVLVQRGRQIMVVQSRKAAYRDVAMAGRYAAWGEYASDGANDAIVLYDLARHTVVRRLGQGLRRANDLPPFDLEGDGVIAFFANLERGGCIYPGWISPSMPRPRFLTGSSVATTIHVARRQIVFFATRSCIDPRGRLELVHLDGQRRSLSTRSPADVALLDFDGVRVAFVVGEGGTASIVVKKT
jgi:hypothetical protein